MHCLAVVPPVPPPSLSVFSLPSAQLRLGATAKAGDKQITLADKASGWRVGDQIGLSPTDYDPFEAETRTIKKVGACLPGGGRWPPNAM